MEKGTKVDSEPYSQNPEVRASLGKQRFHPAKPDLPILPLKLTCVFKKHKCNNSATFPVYKPPTTLPGMVSGLWTEGEKASGQIDKTVLISYLQILKMVDLKRGIFANKQAEEHEEALFCILSAMELLQEFRHTHTWGVFSINLKEKVDELRKSFYSWLQTASNDRCPALVLLLPMNEMWKELTRKSRYYLSCSFACLQTYTHTHTHTHKCPFASAQQRTHNLRENNVVQQFCLTLPEQLLKYFESFIKAPASGRSKYTAGLILSLLSKCMLRFISLRKLMNHRAQSLIIQDLQEDLGVNKPLP